MYIVVVLYLKVGFAIECGGECHVVQRAGRSTGTAEWRHARHAVLRLVGRQLAPQLVSRYVGLHNTTRYYICPIQKTSKVESSKSN